MAFTESELVPIREAMAEFMDHHRPPERTRPTASYQITATSHRLSILA